jgi:hypothetical protein
MALVSKIRFVLGSQVFTTKKAVDAYMRQILHSATVGAPLTGEDFCAVADLLLHHPECESKIGAGIAAISVQIEPNWNSRHFQITRIDGSATDFSFKKCVNHPSQMALFRCACRHLIADQIISFRNAAFDSAGGTIFCPIAGTLLTPKSSHVDHTPPTTFEKLLQQFLAEYSIDVQTVEITGLKDNEMQKGFADLKLQVQWQTFHLSHANLRIVSPRANLSDIKKQSSAIGIVSLSRFES